MPDFLLKLIAEWVLQVIIWKGKEWWMVALGARGCPQQKFSHPIRLEQIMHLFWDGPGAYWDEGVFVVLARGLLERTSGATNEASCQCEGDSAWSRGDQNGQTDGDRKTQLLLKAPGMLEPWSSPPSEPIDNFLCPVHLCPFELSFCPELEVILPARHSSGFHVRWRTGRKKGLDEI